jgi:phosphatidylglycerophosphatase A
VVAKRNKAVVLLWDIVLLLRDILVAEGAQESQNCTPRVGVVPPLAGTLRALVIFVATGAFTGYSPVAPGTVGSMLGLLLVRFAMASVWRYSPVGFLMLFAVVFIITCSVVDCAERIFAEPDCPAIVLDEVLGMIATMFTNPTDWVWLIAGFMLFRLFDIIKPWPASRFNRMRGGAGVMLDDLAAAFYANVALQVLWRIK